MSALKLLAVVLSVLVFLSVPLLASEQSSLPGSITSVAAYHRAYPRLMELLNDKNQYLGSPLFIRIFKQSNELEIWMPSINGRYKHFKTYIICYYSGELGPKVKAGDKQSPEGFYSIGPDQMNPWSKHHLSFNLGYPNEYDQAQSWTGAALMIHGRCSSAGCFAMTDYYMDEIYTLADAALAHGQPEIKVHVFPFRLTTDNLKFHRGSPWLGFWLNLKEGFDLFEKYRFPPRVAVASGRYVFTHEYDQSLARIDTRD